eukprot:4983493-Alexandrium_andersonii.AAC.1
MDKGEESEATKTRCPDLSSNKMASSNHSAPRRPGKRGAKRSPAQKSGRPGRQAAGRGQSKASSRRMRERA